MNGYVPSMTSQYIHNDDDVTVTSDVTSVCRRHNFRSSAPMSNRQTTTTSSCDRGWSVPHVVAYYEIESTKAFPKEARRSGRANVGVEQLRAAIVRLTRGSSGGDGGNDGQDGGKSTVVPLSWWRFARHLATVAETDPSQPCLPLYDVIAIGRSFDVAPRDARNALRHYARRGRVWINDDDDDDAAAPRRCSTSLVVVHPPWIVETIGRVLDTVDSSVVLEQHLLDCLVDSDVERQLSKASRGETIMPSSSARWLLSLLQNLGVCAPLAGSSRSFLFPVLLETGSPGDDVWPETPDWNEKQVTCQIPLRRRRPGQFAGLQVKLGGQAAVRHISVVHHPTPTFFRHHAVFSTAHDVGACEECFRFSRRCRSGGGGSGAGSQLPRSSAIVDHVFCRSTTALVDVPPLLQHTDGSLVALSAPANVVHRVRISVDCQVNSLSVQVRGNSPCCVMHAVVDFINCYLDDDPASAAWSSSFAAVDTCSVKTTDHILTNGGTTVSQSSAKSTWRSRASTFSAYRASYCGSRVSVSGDTSVPEDDDEDEGLKQFHYYFRFSFYRLGFPHPLLAKLDSQTDDLGRLLQTQFLRLNFEDKVLELVVPMQIMPVKF